MHRPLTLDGVPDSLLAEYGFTRGVATEASYRCNDPAATLVPLAGLIVPVGRKLNEPAVRRFLGLLRDGVALDPGAVFREPGAAQATLLDGLHRWHVSKALGFSALPCIYLSRDHAEALHRYPSLT